VNVEPEESILTRLDAEALAARVRARDIAVIDDSARWETAAFSSAPRRPVVVPLLMLLLATLVIESAVAGAGRRKTA
jgi:hypothetical protein